MIQGILLAALGAIGLLIALIIGVVVWVVLKLFKGELNLKIGNDTNNPSDQSNN